MIVVDASVLIAHLDRDDAHHDTAVRLLEEAARAPFSAASLTLAEVLVGPARAGRLAEAETALASLGVREVPLPEGAASRLAALRAQTRLKLPDCCVLLAAQDSRADAVASIDDRLLASARRLGIASL